MEQTDDPARPEHEPLRRLASLLLVERRLLWQSLAFQVLQSLSYLPFFGALGILIDRILQNSSLAPRQKG